MRSTHTNKISIQLPQGMLLHQKYHPQADSRLGRRSPDQLWTLIVAEAALDATDAFRMVPCGHIPLVIRRAKQQVTAHVVKFQVLVGRPVADFEATRICVVDGLGHPSELPIASLGVRGHKFFYGYVWVSA